MDGNEETDPCLAHRLEKRKCPPNCLGRTKKIKKEQAWACDTCRNKKDKCLHKQPPPKLEVTVKQIIQKMKTKRVQEDATGSGTSSTASKKPASGGKTKHVQEAPGSSTAPEKPDSGFGWLCTLRNPGGKMVSFDKIEDPEVLRQMQAYGGSQEPDLAEKYRLKEEAHEERLRREELFQVLSEMAKMP
jgi:hypothetical protein